MKRRFILAFLLTLLAAVPTLAADQHGPQSALNPTKAEETRKYPQIVAFTVSWCPHCKAAKEYFTRNNIPFINRDVELDDTAMTTLTGKYKSQGVPVIVVGTGANEIVLKGFNEDTFNEAVKKVQSAK